jgi:hypothetical protein
MQQQCNYFYITNVKNILIIIHYFREVCKNEYIIPLGHELTALYDDPQMGHSLRSLQTESVRPQMKMTEIS